MPRLITENQENNCLNWCHDLREQVQNERKFLPKSLTRGESLNSSYFWPPTLSSLKFAMIDYI